MGLGASTSSSSLPALAGGLTVQLRKWKFLRLKSSRRKVGLGHLGPSAVSGDMKGTRGDLRTWGNLVLLVSAPRQGQGARVLRG